MIKKLQHKFALSERGAKDLIQGIIACAVQNISFMFPVGLLYFFVNDLLNGGIKPEKIWFYIVGCIIALALIFAVTYWQYNSTFLATYVETGTRRITLAEKLRKIPLSFFGKKDLADLTSTIMADCTYLETAFSHFIPPFIGAMISTVVIAISLFFFDWRMAIASLWVLPVAFAIIGLSSKVQKSLNRKSMDAKMVCADGIQECIETIQDLKANNAEQSYMAGLDTKIDNVEKRSIINEFGTSTFVVSAGLVLKLGIATTALVGSILLVNGQLDVLTFFMFLLVVSRLYDPMQSALQNLAAIISTNTNVARMNEILDHDVQTGNTRLTNKGYDVKFKNVELTPIFLYFISKSPFKVSGPITSVGFKLFIISISGDIGEPTVFTPLYLDAMAVTEVCGTPTRPIPSLSIISQTAAEVATILAPVGVVVSLGFVALSVALLTGCFLPELASAITAELTLPVLPPVDFAVVLGDEFIALVFTVVVSVVTTVVV